MSNPLNQYLEKYTYEYLLNDALAKVPETVDKREGSIIRDALSPACYEVAKAILYLGDIIEQTYINTSNGIWLDGRVLEGNITREPATQAQKLGIFKDVFGNPVTIAIGQSFSTVGDTILNYTVQGVYTDERGQVVAGSYVLTCNTYGAVGNSYIGRIVPNDYIEKLASAEITTLLYPGEEEESDESLRARYLAQINKTAFGGNVAQYVQWAKNIAGIGAVQVYPVWAGGGTVKLSILDTDYNPCSAEFCNTILEKFDPENSNAENKRGLGLGIAPIGHRVNVTSPIEYIINITGKITILPGYSLSVLQPKINEAIFNYFMEVRKSWDGMTQDYEYVSKVYLGRVLYAILGVEGVSSAYELSLNGTETDIILQEDKTIQQIPKLGTVNFVEQ